MLVEGWDGQVLPPRGRRLDAAAAILPGLATTAKVQRARPLRRRRERRGFPPARPSMSRNVPGGKVVLKGCWKSSCPGVYATWLCRSVVAIPLLDQWPQPAALMPGGGRCAVKGPIQDRRRYIDIRSLQ